MIFSSEACLLRHSVLRLLVLLSYDVDISLNTCVGFGQMKKVTSEITWKTAFVIERQKYFSFLQLFSLTDF